MRLVISLHDGTDVDAARRALEAAGLRTTSVLQELGVVTGTADAGALTAMALCPGVAAVEPDGDVHLDPREVPDLRTERANAAPTGASWRSPAWSNKG